MMLLLLSIVAAFSVLGYYSGVDAVDYSQYVNTFTGTENGGNNFPGVARPFGMVKLGPDLFKTGSDAFSGYLAEGVFTGFSMMHEQGTGGAPKYGTVSQLPLVGHIDSPKQNMTVGRAVKDESSVGYYKAQTSDNVIVELAAATRAGMYQYTFPSASEENNVLIDISHVLPSARGQGLGQGYAGGGLKVVSNTDYQGYGVYNNGWNRAPNWTIYFCGSFDQAATSAKAWQANGTEGGTFVNTGTVMSEDSNTPVGGLFTFSEQNVTSRVGISWISISKACQNLATQIPPSTSFSSLVQETKDVWNTEILSKITTSATNETTLQLLYTSLYFMNLIQTDQTGENPGWNSTEPYYSDIFTFWDLFRCSTSLLHIIHPDIYEEQIRSLIDIWRHDGYLPDARSSNYNGRTQAGSNADNILADAYVKGVRGAINWEDGYAAMVKDAEVPPPNTVPPDPQAPDSSTKEGRGALPDWLQYGFITTNYSRSACRAVEYSYNDFSLFQVASGLGYTSDAEKYLNRSRNWRNQWNPTLSSLNFTGFVAPRNVTDFLQSDPLTNEGYWGSDFYEGSSWAYSWGGVHDMGKVVEFMGGRDVFYNRLETMFTPGLGKHGVDNVIFDATNEVTFQVPYLYAYINDPNRAVHHSRALTKSLYSTTPSGLPGNSDAGAMQTYLLWNMIGLYPITGQTTFLIHAPWFSSLTIDLGGVDSGGGEKLLTVTSTGGDNNGGYATGGASGGGGEEGSIYVQSVRVNGEIWEKSWLEWRDVFEEGGTIDFVLGRNPVLWAKGELPPSPATER